MPDFNKYRDELLARKVPADIADKIAQSQVRKAARDRVVTAINAKLVNGATPNPPDPKPPAFIIGTRG